MARNSFFEFKQFRINQENCAMKVGTDGVLLGAWTPIPLSTTRILDIGTGSGLLALMLAQRTHAHIDAVEIDTLAAQQAKENFISSPWSNRLQIYETDFQSFAKNELHKYDVIVSNPPYFHNSLHTPNRQRTIARHSDSLTLDELVDGVEKLLQPWGYFCVILPTHESEIVAKKALLANLYCTQKTFVYPTPTSPAKRIMQLFSKKETTPLTQHLVIEQEQRHQYTKEYNELTKKYFLNI